MLSAIVVLAIIVSTPLINTGTASAEVAPGCDGSTSFLGFPTWYRYLDIGPEGTDECAIIGPMEDGKFDWQQAGAYIGIAVVEILLRLAGLVAVGFVIFGAFRFITSQGEPENTKSARQTIQNALIGLAIVLVSTAAISFVANRLTSSPPPDSGAANSESQVS